MARIRHCPQNALFPPGRHSFRQNAISSRFNCTLPYNLGEKSEFRGRESVDPEIVCFGGLRPLTDDPSFLYKKLVRETWIVCQGPNYSSVWRYRSHCIVLFTNSGGVPIILLIEVICYLRNISYLNMSGYLKTAILRYTPIPVFTAICFMREYNSRFLPTSACEVTCWLFCLDWDHRSSNWTL